MAGRIGDNKGTLRCREKPMGNIDGYSLLPLILQSVKQQRKINVIPRGAKPPRLLLQCRQVVVKDQRAIVEEPADQRRLAVID